MMKTPSTKYMNTPIYPKMDIQSVLFKDRHFPYTSIIQNVRIFSNVRIKGDDGKWYLVLHKTEIEFGEIGRESTKEHFAEAYSKNVEVAVEKHNISCYNSVFLYESPDRMLKLTSGNIGVVLDSDQRSEEDRLKSKIPGYENTKH